MSPAYGVFTVACASGLFFAIKATMGLRVSEEEELEGLDYGEHGMHAYDVAPIGAGSPAGSVPAASATTFASSALAPEGN